VKTFFLWTVWLLLVGTSVFYTIDGLTSVFPGSKVFLYLTDMIWLGLALSLGQYAMLHTGFILTGKKVFRFVTVGIVALLFGSALTVLNVSYAYVSISTRYFSTELVEQQSVDRVSSRVDQIKVLEGRRQDILDLIRDLPKNQGTNRRKQYNESQIKITEYEQQIKKLRDEMEAIQDKDIVLKQEAKGADRLKDVVGFNPSKILAISLAGALDPMAVILLLTLTAWSGSITKKKAHEVSFFTRTADKVGLRSSKVPVDPDTREVSTHYSDKDTPVSVFKYKLKK